MRRRLKIQYAVKKTAIEITVVFVAGGLMGVPFKVLLVLWLMWKVKEMEGY